MDADELAEPFPWRRELALALASGVVTVALPVHRWPRGARLATHAGLGLAAAGGTAWFIRGSGDRDPQETASEAPLPLGLAATLGIASAVGLATAGASAGGTALDHALERGLADRGVRRPRWWIGGLAAAVSFAFTLVDRRMPSKVS